MTRGSRCDLGAYQGAWITTVEPATITAGQPGSDTAQLLSTSPSAVGDTVTYTIYTNSTCTTAATTQVSGQPAPVTVGAGDVVPNSPAVTFYSAGTLYFQASFSGDAGNGAASSPCSSEPVNVIKTTTTVSTTLVNSAIQAAASGADSATLGGVDSVAGGTVTFTVYSNSTCTTAATTTSGATVGQIGSQPAAVTVTAGVLAGNASATFNQVGSFSGRRPTRATPVTARRPGAARGR